MNNNDVVRALQTIATLMEIKDEAYYRVLGYTRAAESVAALGRQGRDVEDLTELPHVGKTTAEVIRDLAEDRTPRILADLVEEIPASLVEVTRLPGVGPKSAQRIAFHLLDADDAAVRRLAEVLVQVKDTVRFCEICGNVSADERCRICADARRSDEVMTVAGASPTSARTTRAAASAWR